MTPGLLLDDHIPRQVARQLRAQGVDALSLAEWQGGQYRLRPDDEILRAAYADGRVLVTYDVRTIPPLLHAWSAAGVEHAGVILISTRTIRPGDVVSLVDALQRLLALYSEQEWDNRVLFLSR